MTFTDDLCYLSHVTHLLLLSMHRLNHYATGSQASRDFNAQKCFHSKNLHLHKLLFTVEHV